MKAFFKVISNGRVSKLLVALFGAATSALSLYAGNARWEPIAVSVLTAILVAVVPNTPKA